MEAFLTSAVLVAIAEIGDKTQLLAIVLATRFRRPLAVVAGILAATLANHALAAWAGALAAGLLAGTWFRLAVALSFLAMAAWALLPDRRDDEAAARPARFGVFLTTAVAFFVVEIGDKTQIATVALAARFQDVALVTFGTTLGMMLANVPAVYLGERASKVVPLRYIRLAAAAVFLALGGWTLAEVLQS